MSQQSGGRKDRWYGTRSRHCTSGHVAQKPFGCHVITGLFHEKKLTSIMITSIARDTIYRMFWNCLQSGSKVERIKPSGPLCCRRWVTQPGKPFFMWRSCQLCKWNLARAELSSRIHQIQPDTMPSTRWWRIIAVWAPDGVSRGVICERRPRMPGIHCAIWPLPCELTTN